MKKYPLSRPRSQAYKVLRFIKAAAALPSSLRKKAEILKSLAKQFNLKVQYSNQNKVDRPSNALTEADIDWLKKVFDGG